MTDSTTETKAIDPLTLDAETGSSYPSPFDELVQGRKRRRLGDAFGLSQFGVNLVHLPPGAGCATGGSPPSCARSRPHAFAKWTTGKSAGRARMGTSSR